MALSSFLKTITRPSCHMLIIYQGKYNAMKPKFCMLAAGLLLSMVFFAPFALGASDGDESGGLFSGVAKLIANLFGRITGYVTYNNCESTTSMGANNEVTCVCTTLTGCSVSLASISSGQKTVLKVQQAYDPSYTGSVSLESDISYIDGVLDRSVSSTSIEGTFTTLTSSTRVGIGNTGSSGLVTIKTITTSCSAYSIKKCDYDAGKLYFYNDCGEKGSLAEDCTSGCEYSGGQYQCKGPACMNECLTEGVKECSGSGYRTCGSYDSDSCTEWSSVTACPSGHACSDGECISSCTPSCSGKQCGDDGCGGTCGTCSSDQTCTSGQCVQSSTRTYVSFGSGYYQSGIYATSTTTGNTFGYYTTVPSSVSKVKFSLTASTCMEASMSSPCTTSDAGLYTPVTCEYSVTPGQTLNFDVYAYYGLCRSTSPGSFTVKAEAYTAPAAPSCSNECSSSGAKECYGSGYRTCGNYDSDSCLEWSSAASCSSGQTCSGGSCITSTSTTTECAPGCRSSWRGDGECDTACNNAACNHDNGDCTQQTVKKSNGQTCSSSSDCQSANCGNSICCASGKTCCSSGSQCSSGYECSTSYHYCIQSSTTTPTTECAPGCISSWKGDGACDTACNNAACAWDNGDCTQGNATSSGGCAAGCYQSWLGDDECDTVCNNAACNYDDGDCTQAEQQTTQKQNGEYCSADSECASTYCGSRGVCCGIGNSCCNDDSQCDSGMYCDNVNKVYECKTKKSVNEPCNLNKECKSGLCIDASRCADVQAEKKGLGDECSLSSDCEAGLSCKYRRAASDRLYCCPAGNTYCCSNDADCGKEGDTQGWYCYKGTDPDASKHFSCQQLPAYYPTPTKLPKTAQLKGLGMDCTSDSECQWNHCSNGVCCGSGTCCKNDGQCMSGETCSTDFHKCFRSSTALENQAMADMVAKRSGSIDTLKESDLDANFYVDTYGKEGKGVVGNGASAVLAVANRGSTDFYVKANIDKVEDAENGEYDISRWEPGELGRLESIPAIGLFVKGLKKANTLVWMAVQALWAAEKGGFLKVPGNSVLTLKYYFEPSREGQYTVTGTMKYYTKGDFDGSYDANSDTYQTTNEGFLVNVKTKAFSKSLEVRRQDCGILGLVCT